MFRASDRRSGGRRTASQTNLNQQRERDPFFEKPPTTKRSDAWLLTCELHPEDFPVAASCSIHSISTPLARKPRRTKEMTRDELRSDERRFFVLSTFDIDGLRRFQYQGQDRSLLYYYVFSPLAQFCVDRLTPRWIAPNVITLSGLGLMVVSYLIFWFYAPLVAFTQEPPRWVFLYNGIAILLYQTLDNMDGKQARRTQTGSPLGLLFDHGCDAVNSLFGSVNWMIAMGLDPRTDSWMCYSMLLGPYALFFIGTWEEYYTGELIMPIVNGPNEGLLGAACMSFLSAAYGTSFWQGTTFWTSVAEPILQAALPVDWALAVPALRHADLLVLASNFGFVQETLPKIWSVGMRYGPKSIESLAPFVVLLVAPLILAYQDLELVISMPRTLLHLIAFLFVEMTTALMLAHICGARYRALRWPLLPMALLAFRFDAANLLMYTSVMGTYLACRTVLVIDEVCRALDLSCFDTTKRRTATNGHAKVH